MANRYKQRFLFSIQKIQAAVSFQYSSPRFRYIFVFQCYFWGCIVQGHIFFSRNIHIYLFSIRCIIFLYVHRLHIYPEENSCAPPFSNAREVYSILKYRRGCFLDKLDFEYNSPRICRGGFNVVLGTSYLFGVKLLEGLHEALIQRYWSRSQDLFDVAFTKDIGPDHQIFWMQFLRKIYWSRPSDFWMQFLQKLLVQNIRFFGCSFYERYIGADPPPQIFLGFSNLLLQHLLMPFHSFWDEVSHRPRSAFTVL